MQLIRTESYEALAQRAADDLELLLQGQLQPLVCTASGDSPAGLYRRLAARRQDDPTFLSAVQFVGLDEWAGMNGTDEGSCRYHLDRQLYGPLEVPEGRICFFDGRASDKEAECARVRSFITEGGGIELAILGLGGNGHVGMNEPGTPARAEARLVDIAEETQRTGQKYFTSPRDLAQGLTLGLAELLAARHLFLLVSGRHKAGILKRILTEAPSEQLPATLLLPHPGLRIYVDEEAAELI